MEQFKGNILTEIVVPPMSAKAFKVQSGETVRIIDTVGKQPGDFVAFTTNDMAIKFSQARSRIENNNISLTQGGTLWTNSFPPEIMFTVINDSYGAHDLLYPACCRYALKKRFSTTRDGCLENLEKALNPWGVAPYEIPDPLNLFFSVYLQEEGRMVPLDAASSPGSYIDLKANLDCIVAIATCSVPFPEKKHSEYLIKLFDNL